MSPEVETSNGERTTASSGLGEEEVAGAAEVDEAGAGTLWARSGPTGGERRTSEAAAQRRRRRGGMAGWGFARTGELARGCGGKEKWRVCR